MKKAGPVPAFFALERAAHPSLKRAAQRGGGLTQLSAGYQLNVHPFLC